MDITKEADQYVAYKRLSLYIKYEDAHLSGGGSSTADQSCFPIIQFSTSVKNIDIPDILEQDKRNNQLMQIQKELSNNPSNNNNNSIIKNNNNGDKLFVSQEITEELGHNNSSKKSYGHYYTLEQKNISALDALSEEMERNKLTAKFVEVKYCTEQMIGDLKSSWMLNTSSSSAPLLLTTSKSNKHTRIDTTTNNSTNSTNSTTCTTNDISLSTHDITNTTMEAINYDSSTFMVDNDNTLISKETTSYDITITLNDADTTLNIISSDIVVNNEENVPTDIEEVTVANDIECNPIIVTDSIDKINK